MLREAQHAHLDAEDRAASMEADLKVRLGAGNIELKEEDKNQGQYNNKKEMVFRNKYCYISPPGYGDILMMDKNSPPGYGDSVDFGGQLIQGGATL